MPHKYLSLAISLAFSALSSATYADVIQGPSSSASPYLVPVAPGVDIISLLTVGDSVNVKPDGSPYRMVGIPDGLGVLRGEHGTFTVLMNHELGNTAGVARAHGGLGAFVSKWSIKRDTLQVVKGEDLIQQAYLYDKASGSYVLGNKVSFSRFCSADLPAKEAFYNKHSKKGTPERIFMNGEESGSEGRAFAHIVTGPNAGKSYELPYLGKFSWENAVANPYRQDKTIVIGTDDNSSKGQIYVYVGQKKSLGNEIERAGLSGGGLYGIRVLGSAQAEDRLTGFSGNFDLVSLGDVSSKSGAELNTLSASAGVSEFLRPEDSAWDPKHPNVLYVATTDRYDNLKDGTGSQVGRSRIYRFTFTDLSRPELGGTVAQVITGTEATQMMDNLTVSKNGNVVIQEDVGNNPRSGKIWLYQTKTQTLTEIAKHDPARFGDYSPATPPYSQDEESSGVIDITDFVEDADWAKRGMRYYLGVVQAHYSFGGELVEGGQLNVLGVPSNKSGHDEEEDSDRDD